MRKKTKRRTKDTKEYNEKERERGKVGGGGGGGWEEKDRG